MDSPDPLSVGQYAVYALSPLVSDAPSPSQIEKKRIAVRCPFSHSLQGESYRRSPFFTIRTKGIAYTIPFCKGASNGQ